MFNEVYDQPLYRRPSALAGTKLAMRYAKLSDRPGEWATEVLDHLFSEFPSLSDSDVNISFQSRDEKSGYALGKIVIDSKLSIPLFVEKRMLAPLDTFVYKGKPYRMTERRLKEVLFKTATFGKMVTPEDEKALIQDEPIYQQTQVNDFREGRRVFACDFSNEDVARETAYLEALTKRAMDRVRMRPEEIEFTSILERILPTVSKTAQEDIRDMLNGDVDLLCAYQTNKFAQAAIVRVLEHQPVEVEKVAELAMGQGHLPANIIQLIPESSDRFVLKTASDFGYEETELPLVPSAVAPILENRGLKVAENLAKLAAGQVVTHVSRHENLRPDILDDYKSTDQITKFGCYRVRDFAGNDYTGWIYPEVYDFDKHATGRMLFVGEFRQMQEKIAGIELELDSPPELPNDKPQIGDTGCFVFDTDTTGIATIPVKIAAIESDDEAGTLHIKASSFMGKPVCFRVSDRITDMVPVQKTAAIDTWDHYMLPSRAKWVKLSASRKLVDNNILLDKMACASSFPSALKIRNVGDTFVFHGLPMRKVGQEDEEFSKDEALFKLCAMGMDTPDAMNVINRSMAKGDITIANVNTLEPLEEKQASIIRNNVLPALANIPYLRQDTTKIATEIKDPEILDRVLSLNFLSPENMGILVDHVKELEKANSIMSELIIASRYGAKTDLNEDALVQGRKALDDVADGLEQLSSRMGSRTDGDD